MKPTPTREQTSLDFTGITLRDEGMERAITHADMASLNWSDRAFLFLYKYAKSHSTFSGEQVREASKDKLEAPPHLRAWGGVIMSAAKRGVIEKIGYIQVENPLAHKANAALWKSKIHV